MTIPSQFPVLHLDKEIANEIIPNVLKLSGSPYDNVDQYLSLLHSSFISHLPSKFLEEVSFNPLLFFSNIYLFQVRKFREEPDAPGAMVVRGLPIDHFLPPTPLDGDRSKEKTTFVSEASLLALSLLFGEVFGISQVSYFPWVITSYSYLLAR
jgi:L-asparagine oxygenase